MYAIIETDPTGLVERVRVRPDKEAALSVALEAAYAQAKDEQTKQDISLLLDLNEWVQIGDWTVSVAEIESE